MELRHLRYFVAVAEELHFGRAAEKLHMAQPPLSQQIMNLEGELGVKLFVRAKRQVRLTDAGIFFFKEAKRILLQAEQAVQTARQIDHGEKGRLAVGFVGSVVHTFLPEGLRLFRERFPDVELVLHELNSYEQVRALHEKRLDIGFHYPSSHDETLSFESLIRAPLIVAMPKRHALARHKIINISDLAQEPFIVFTRASEPVINDTFISLCRAAGFSPRMSQEAAQIQTVLGIVASGLGICLIPDYVKNIKRPGVLYRPLSCSQPLVELAVIWRSENLSSLVKSFVKVIGEVIRQS